MSKLRLNVDEITVETFQTGEDLVPRRGTVEAHGGNTVKIICTVASLKTDLTCCPCTPEF